MEATCDLRRIMVGLNVEQNFGIVWIFWAPCLLFARDLVLLSNPWKYCAIPIGPFHMAVSYSIKNKISLLIPWRTHHQLFLVVCAILHESPVSVFVGKFESGLCTTPVLFLGLWRNTEWLNFIWMRFVSVYLRNLDKNLGLKLYRATPGLKQITRPVGGVCESVFEEPQGPPPHHLSVQWDVDFKFQLGKMFSICDDASPWGTA